MYAHDCVTSTLVRKDWRSKYDRKLKPEKVAGGVGGCRDLSEMAGYKYPENPALPPSFCKTLSYEMQILTTKPVHCTVNYVMFIPSFVCRLISSVKTI